MRFFLIMFLAWMGAVAGVQAQEVERLKRSLERYHFNSEQTKCTVKVLRSLLSKDEIETVSLILDDNHIAIDRDGSEKVYSEFEKASLLDTISEFLPPIAGISGFGEGEQNWWRITGLGNKVSSEIRKRCISAFQHPNLDDYYEISDEYGSRYFRRSAVKYDEAHRSSREGLAYCIKLFRYAFGADPNGLPQKRVQRLSSDFWDLERALFLTKWLIAQYSGDAESAGKYLAYAGFSHTEDGEATCRAWFPDVEFSYWIYEKSIDELSESEDYAEIKAALKQAYEAEMQELALKAN